MIRHRLSGILVATLLFAAGQACAQEKQKITITWGGDGMHYFPVYIARGAGLFAEEGLEVDWVNMNSGTSQAASVMGGSAEMTPLALMHVIKSSHEGGNLVAFASVFNVYALTLVMSNEAVAKAGITPDMPIDEKIRRLRGFSIGITAPGSATDTLVRNLFLVRGMNPDTSVKLQPFGNGNAILAAFEKKLSDGIVFAAPIPETAQRKGLGVAVVDPFKNEVPELAGVPFVVMATSRQTLAAKPKVIAAATRAIARGMRFAHERPEEARKLMRQYFPSIDQEVFDLVVEKHRASSPTSPEISRDQVAKTLAWMNLGVPTPIKVDYDDVVNAAIARDAAASIR